jgi:3-methyladenine DNA glycosylase AlkD
MKTKNTISSILNELKKLGCTDRAVRDKAYHKSKREHWGVPVPTCDQLARSLSKELSETEMLQLASSLWETDLFDPMMCSAKMLSLSKLPPSPELWKTVIAFLGKVDGWALEDSLANVAWKCILANESLLEVLESWTTHENFWMRRATLVYTLPFAKPNRDPERSLRWASTYSTDSEWFIQKAIGWWLRVLGEHRPERVVAFLKSYWDNLKPVARHEATRKLDQQWKQQVASLSTRTKR